MPCDQSELDDGESIERRIRQRNALAYEELANLRQPEAGLEPALNRDLLCATPVPILTARSSAARVQRQQHVAQLRLIDRVAAHAQTCARRHGDVPPNRFRIEPQPCGDAFLRHAVAPEAKYFGDFNHPDLAIHPGPPAAGQGPGLKTVIARSDEGGKGFEKLSAQRGKGFEKVVTPGSIGFENRQITRIARISFDRGFRGLRG